MGSCVRNRSVLLPRARHCRVLLSDVRTKKIVRTKRIVQQGNASPALPPPSQMPDQHLLSQPDSRTAPFEAASVDR